MSWVKDHKAVAVVGGGALVLGGAFVAGSRKRSPAVSAPASVAPRTTGVTADGTTVSVPANPGVGLSDAWVDIFTTRLDAQGVQIGGLKDLLIGLKPGPSMTTEPKGGGSSGTTSGGTTTATPAKAQPTVQINPGTLMPIFSSPVGLGGMVVGGGTVSNPASAVVPTPTYTPSAMDILSSFSPISYELVLTPGSNQAQGLTYSVYNTDAGSGAPVPPSSRIPGERYDSYGRVIL